MRLFIAVPLDPGVRRALGGLIESLRPRAPRARWVRPDGAHLTLAFLGDVPQERAADAAAAMSEAARGAAPFRIEFEGAGAFPSWRSPKVLWVGVGLGARELEGVAGTLARALGERAFGLEERPFQAHLTVCRLDGPAPDLEAAARKAAAGPLGAMEAQSLSLVESRLGPGGARYAVLAEAPLTGS